MICLLCVLSLYSGCTSRPAEQIPSVRPEPENIVPGPRVYLPIQSVYMVRLDPGNPDFEKDLVILHLDRRDGYSVRPERLVFTPGRTMSLSPVVQVGKRGLDRADVLILRTSRLRYALRETEYSLLPFNQASAERIVLPEFIVYSPYITTSFTLGPGDMRNRRNGIRKGIEEDLKPEAFEKLKSLLTREELLIIKRLFSQERIFTDYEGIHSLLVLPGNMLTLPEYEKGIRLVFSPETGFNPSVPESFSLLHIYAETDDQGIREHEGIMLGDMGVFSGGTVLLEPELTRHTRNLVSARNITRMPGPSRLNSSPVTMSGSFNIYRDERNRYLWYPGIISYIPGNHPDISDGDVRTVFGISRRQLDSMLLDTKKLYYGTNPLKEGLPLFFLAAPSAREVETAYEMNSAVREKLKEFLEQPAHSTRWFD